jgi:hypothetical protein
VLFRSTMFPIIAFFRLWNSLFTRNENPQTSYMELPKFLNDFIYKILKVEVKAMNKINLQDI